MKKYKELIKYLLDKPIGFTFISNIATLILGLLVFRPFFDDGNDLNMAMIAEGVYGRNDYHLVLSNVVLGKIESFLCNVLPFIRWHTLLQYMLVLSAMLVLGYYFAHFKYGRIVSFIIQLAIVYEVYVAFGSTKNAGVITAVSIIIILGIIKRKIIRSTGSPRPLAGIMRAGLGMRGENVLLILSNILLLFGYMIGQEGFFVAVLILTVPGFIDFLCLAKRYKGKAVLKYTQVIVVAVVLTFVLGMADYQVYAMNPEWNYFKQYDSFKAQLINGCFEDNFYETHGDELNELGISENDAYLYTDRQFADEKVAPPTLLSDMTALINQKHVNADLFKGLMTDLYHEVHVVSPTVIALLASIGVLLAMCDAGSLCSIFLLCETVLCFAMSVFCKYSSIWNHRTIYTMIIVLLLADFSFMITSAPDYFASIKKTWRSSGDKMNYRAVIVPLWIVLGAMVLLLRIGNELDYQDYLSREQDFAVLKMYIEQEKETLFVADALTTEQKYKYNVLSPLKESSLDNYVDTGNYLTASPIEHEIVKKYGYFDPFDALRRGTENVVLIDNNCPDRKALFLTEHGDGPRYAADFVENICGYNLYKIK